MGEVGEEAGLGQVGQGVGDALGPLRVVGAGVVLEDDGGGEEAGGQGGRLSWTEVSGGRGLSCRVWRCSTVIGCLIPYADRWVSYTVRLIAAENGGVAGVGGHLLEVGVGGEGG